MIDEPGAGQTNGRAVPLYGLARDLQCTADDNIIGVGDAVEDHQPAQIDAISFGNAAQGIADFHCMGVCRRLGIQVPGGGRQGQFLAGDEQGGSCKGRLFTARKAVWSTPNHKAIWANVSPSCTV